MLRRRLQDGPPSTVALIAAIAVSGLALSLIGRATSAWAGMPVALRFAAGIVAFGLSPGLLIAAPLLARRTRTLEASDILISVFTCSFSCNLVLNIILFTSALSFADVVTAYLVVQAAGYAAWGAVAWRGRRSSRPRTPVAARGPAGGVAIALAAGVAALVCAAYMNGAPPVNPEEVVSLRKLADNPVVRYDNLSFRDGDPSTYLFVPFQILIAGASLVSQLDVVLTYSLFWAVTTLLSIGVTTRLAFVIFGRRDVAALVCFTALLIGFFDPRSVIYDAGILTPYPNRYGFGSGVLLPLGLLLFWSILRDPGVPIWRWALLMYLVIETTFVHARETLLGMGAMLAVFVVLAARPARHGASLARIAAGIGLMIVTLVAYKYGNLSLAPQLGAYVTGLSEASNAAADMLIREEGSWGAMLTEAPGTLRAAVDGTTIQAQIAGYRSLFVETWREGYPGRLYLPVALLTLPLYALWARSLAQLSLVTLLASLSLVVASGWLQLRIAAIVGSPEIFVAYNIIFIVALYIFADEVAAIGRLVARAGLGTRRTLIVGSLLALVLYASFAFNGPLDEWRYDFANGWTRTATWTLIGATWAAVIFRLARRDLPLFPEAVDRPTPPLGWITACALTVAILMPAIRQSDAWRRSPFRPEYAAGGFSGDLVADYDRLVSSRKLEPAVYPADIVRFLRERVPPNQTILSRDTLALLLTAPHFAAIVSIAGGVPPSFIANADYLRTFAVADGGFDLRTHLAGEERRALFLRMLRELKVDIVVAHPEEAPDMARARAESPDLGTALEALYEAEGFTVYRVRASHTAETKSDDTQNPTRPSTSGEWSHPATLRPRNLVVPAGASAATVPAVRSM